MQFFVHENLNLNSGVQYTSLKYDYKPHRIDYEKQGILGIGCTQLSIELIYGTLRKDGTLKVSSL